MDTKQHDAPGATTAHRSITPVTFVAGLLTGIVGYLAVSAATWAAVEPPHASARLGSFGLLAALLAAGTVVLARTAFVSAATAGLTVVILAFIAAVSPERMPDAGVNFVLAGGTSVTGFVLGACILSMSTGRAARR
ncbi:hypothetical protein [Cellulomonas sp. Y8]|uniref:hypothetical protein n=1 Tax=Cellulomonas sp. Y8 TaxID=2591145 RepID=UPI0011CA3720|nr:hypothetical protein [Cellulomonas sp. Y8]